MKRIQGMVSGMLLGATAVTLYGLMNARTQRRIERVAVSAGRRAARFVGDLMGR